MTNHLQQLNRSLVLVLLVLLISARGLLAQSKSVSGVVKDSNGESLPGVTILEKGTNNGTITDAEGKFTISVSEGAVLVATFIGMKPIEIQVGNQTTISITMNPDVTQLDEVVVIGYGTAKKSDLTGSVASISGTDLKKIPVASVAESLTGRLAGVQVQGTEGAPDAEIKIRVRGGNSITQDNSPLYIVDGFPVNTISDITPSDIQSIDVLKDASSTAIYGSRGANGVIIITTKSGKEGKLSVNYNTFFGVKRIAKTLDVLSPEDYVKWQYEYALLENDLPSYQDYFGLYQDQDLYKGMKGVNWQEQVYGQTGEVTSHDLSVRGGSDKFNYAVNYALFDEKSILIGSGFKRNNITLKLNNKPTDKIDLAFSLRYSNTKINGGGTNEQNEVSSADSRLKNSISYPPMLLPGISSTETDEALANSLVNPITANADNDRQQERKNFNMAGSIGWDVIDNLKWRTEFGLDNYGYEDDRFYGRSTYYINNIPAAENQGLPAAILRSRDEVRFRNTNTLNYNFKKFLGDEHNATLLVGQEMIKTEVSQLTSVIHGYPSLFTSDQAFRLTTQGDAQSTDNNFSPDDKLLSFFTRANYDFRGRYLLTATFRADGSSKFLGNNRWGYFPSAAVAWKVSEEGFMESTKNWLNSLKLRFSYGVAGNNNIPVGQTVQTFESSTTTWMNGFDSFWAASKTLANPKLKWETTHTRNLGLDFSSLQGRLSGSFEAYINNTVDQLISFPVAGTGYDNQFRNIGETQNKGIEASLSYIAIDKKDYGLSFSFNIGFNRNEIKSLGSLENFGINTNWASTEIGNDFLIVKGNSVGNMYGFQNDGRYEVDDFEGYNAGTNTWTLKPGVANGSAIVGRVAPGVMKLKDRDGDGAVTVADQTIIGNANPKHTGGFVLNGYAYGFDLTAAFNWSFGNDVYNANKIEFTSTTPRHQYRNMITVMEDGKRWTNVDPATGALVTDATALAALNENTTMWSPYMARFVFSDWAVEDGSFLRLNTLTLGYSLPTSLVSKARIQSLRFYVTGYNLFIITNYSGFDPEVSTRRRTNLTPGVDYSAYPRSRQLVFGLNLNF
jgi:TonB-linked SusC/RagA family outer membrane protein